jgi:hypothetical protein
VSRQHPARAWVEQQGKKSVAHELEQMPTPSECGHHLLQMVTKLQQGADAAAEEVGWRAADPSRYPQHVCRGLARLLSHRKVTSEGARWLAQQIGGRLPPGWGAVWMERGCSKLEGTLAEQLQQVVDYLRAMETRCVRCQVRQAGTCRQCHLGWCTLCQQEKGECNVCSAPITSTTNPGAADGKSYAHRSKAKGMKGAEVISVNMHRLGESFVENVSDVRRRATVDGNAAAPGESPEFLAQIRGWQSEARKQRRDQLLQLNDIGDVRKEQAEFERNEWHKEQPAICARCVTGRDAGQASTSTKRMARKRIKNITNHQARRPRAANGRGIAAREATSESDENEEERVKWGTRKYGVRMSPAHPRYVGRGDDACGGEVVYTIQEIRTLLRSQPEDAKRWLTTGQMGWALTREENEVINAKDEREGKPVARQIALMISKFIRAQCESEELEDVDDERRQILEGAA